MQCKLFKLTNGQDIIAHTDEVGTDWIGKSSVSMVDPVVLQPYRFPRGNHIVETFVLIPWVKAAEYDVITLPTKNIMLILDLKENLASQYEQFIHDLNHSDIQPQQPESVKDFLDQMFSEEENDDEEEITEYHERTIH